MNVTKLPIVAFLMRNMIRGSISKGGKYYAYFFYLTYVTGLSI